MSADPTPFSRPSNNPASPLPPFNPAGARPSTQAERTRRQAGLFFGGAAFALLSGLITRRALVRRNRPLGSLSTSTAEGAPGTQSGSTVLSKGAPKSSEAQGYSPASKELPSFAGKTAAEAEVGAGKNAASDASAAEGTSELAAELETSGPIMAVEALTLATLNVFSWAVMATGGLMYAFDIGNLEDLRRKVRGGMGFDGSGRTEEEAQEEVEEWIVDVLARKERKEMIRERIAKEAEANEKPSGGWKNERGRER